MLNYGSKFVIGAFFITQHDSGMAQRKRIGPITQGSVDRNYLPLDQNILFRTHNQLYLRQPHFVFPLATDPRSKNKSTKNHTPKKPKQKLIFRGFYVSVEILTQPNSPQKSHPWKPNIHGKPRSTGQPNAHLFLI